MRATLLWATAVACLTMPLQPAAAQLPDDEPVGRARLSILGQLGGPELLGGFVGYHLNEHVVINAGIGLDFDVHIGANTYLRDRNQSAHSFYVGAQLISYNEFRLFGGVGDRQAGLFIPVGYEYLAKSGFTVQIDVGPNFVKTDWGQNNTGSLLASVRLGITRRTAPRPM